MPYSQTPDNQLNHRHRRAMNWRNSVGSLARIVLGLGILAGAACTTLEVQEAFDGDFPPDKNNTVIINYCQSCHIHRDFEPAGHIEEMRVKYRKSVYRTATECRACHYLDKKFTRDQLIRGTRSPKEVKRGEHRKFEKSFKPKKSKKRKKSKKSIFDIF